MDSSTFNGFGKSILKLVIAIILCSFMLGLCCYSMYTRYSITVERIDDTRNK